MGDILSTETGETSGGIEIFCSEDNIEAYMMLSPNENGYTVALIRSRLKEMNITTGIMDDEIRDVIEQKRYGEKVKIAEGIKPVHGEDGWYEFLFETEIDNKPKILADGSVDYSMYGDIPAVDEGAIVAVYHPSLDSKDGVNVFGELLVAKKGKNMAKLSGRGLLQLEDGCTYVAKYGGKITYMDGKVFIEQELVIEKDVSPATGDVTYRNDIHVRGNVLAGATVISEKGSIIVDGYVESATLKAGKDVILKNGMQGNAKGSIEAGGDVSGKFFEQVKVRGGNDVNANAIMNSTIQAGQDVIVSGRFGIIIGGEIRAHRQIQATIIGNTSELENRIYAGVDSDVLAMINHCERTIQAAELELAKVIRGLESITELIEKTGKEELKEKKLLLMRTKIEKDSKLSEMEKEKEDLLELYSKTNQAKVTVMKVVYPGTIIAVNGMRKNVTEMETRVEYARRGPGIIAYHLEEA